MFWLTAIVRPFKLDDLYEQLLSEGVRGMTVTEVKGVGTQHIDSEIYRGNSYSSMFLPKIKIELAVKESDMSRIIEKIIETSKTGKKGDGKIFVTRLESSLRIRTGETDHQAI